MKSRVPSDVAFRPLVRGQASQLLRATLSASDEAIMLTSLDHTTLAANPRFGQVFGVDPQAIVNGDIDDVRAMVRGRIVDAEKWEAQLEEIYADPELVRVDHLELRHPRMILRRYTAPVRAEDGTPVGRLWTFLDVTGDVRLARMQGMLSDTIALHHAEPSEVYRAVLDRVSTFYETLVLLSVREEEFMAFRAVGAPQNHPAHGIAGNTVSQSFCQYCLRDQQPVIIQDAAKDPQYADLLPVKMGLTRYAGVPLFAPDGAPIGTLCILDDRTDEILDDEDLRFLGVLAMRISSELERERQLDTLRRVLESTNQELEVARLEAMRNDRLAVTGTLAASVAHDIRNILSALSLDLALADDPLKESLKTVRMHLDRFNVLSHRLLSYAKPKQVVHLAADVTEVLDRVISLLDGTLRASRIDLVRKFEPVPTVLADPYRLDHLFVNLILNSIQVMQHGGTILVTTTRHDQAVVVEVNDTGPGIPSDRLPQLFEPFNSARQDGFGLGLYSCEQIVYECGGRIEVETEIGVGTTFRVVLPIHA
ncbi:MAG: ATP-binding protein [Fimbriimonas sp.]